MSAECIERESKVLYKEGDELRAIRGVITSEDQFFLYISRRDGDLRIAKGVVIKVENWRGASNERRT